MIYSSLGDMTYNLKVMDVNNVGDWILFCYKTLKLLWIKEKFEFLFSFVSNSIQL